MKEESNKGRVEKKQRKQWRKGKKVKEGIMEERKKR